MNYIQLILNLYSHATRHVKNKIYIYKQNV